MAVKLGNGNWAVKEDKLLAYNDNSGLFFNKEFDFSRGTSATYVAKDGLIKTAGIQPNIVNNGDFSELGSEVITNGDFSQSGTPSSSSYTLGWYSPDPGVSISNGELSLTKQSPLCRAYATDGISVIAFLTTGKTYKLVYTVTENNQGATLRYYNGTYININGSVGTHTLYYKAATQYFILLNASDNKTIKLDSVSVKQVDPNDYWTLGTGWSVGDNKATSDASANSYLNQQAYEIGKTYKLGFEVLEGTIELRSAQYSKGTGFYTTGTYSIEVIPTTISTHFYVYTGFGQSSITNITVQEIQTDTPRIDFTNDTKGHLLLEPSSTNLLPYSEDFSQWSKTNTTTQSNSSTSPVGTQNATKIIANNGSTNNRIFISGISYNGTYSLSVFGKANGANSIKLGGQAAGFSAEFNLNTGTVVNEINSNANIINYGNDWYRCVVVATATATGQFLINLIETGDGTSGVLLWGAQLESGDFSTSYIPTTGAASTRNADVCNNSGSAQDFNSEEGVLYAEIAALADDGTFRLISISDGTGSNRVYIGFRNNSNMITSIIDDGGSSQATFNYTVTDTKSYHKVAIKYKENDVQFYVDGQQVGTDTSATIPLGLNSLQFTSGALSSKFYGNVRNVQVFTEALTDEQLQKLTS
jgi:hypothetical protein